MTFATTLATELRAIATDLAVLAPSSKRPTLFAERKASLEARLQRVVDMLEGNFEITAPEPEPAPKPKTKPKVTVEGSVIAVDFQARRKAERPASNPR